MAFYAPPVKNGSLYMFSLHESIIAYQGGRRLATTQDTHTGYRRYGRVSVGGVAVSSCSGIYRLFELITQVTARNEIYPGDTSCDFKTLSDEPILISYCCANTHNGTQEMTEELNISLLQAYSRGECPRTDHEQTG